MLVRGKYGTTHFFVRIKFSLRFFNRLEEKEQYYLQAAMINKHTTGIRHVKQRVPSAVPSIITLILLYKASERLRELFFFGL